jgi:general stress protein 13
MHMSDIRDYKPGMIVYGKVNGIKPYGVFVNFDNGVSGLIHISEISNGFVKKIDNYIKVDSYILTKVIDVDYENRQLKLSYKALNQRKRNSNKAYQSELPPEKIGFKTIRDNLEKWKQDYLVKNGLKEKED